MQKNDVCRVFAGSPDDVEVERKIVLKVLNDLNQDPLVEEKQISFKAEDWSDVLPLPGRPQGHINELLDSCDVFICILYRKYGTPAGKYRTGIMEEFYNAYESWKNTDRPLILLYYKKDVKPRSEDEENDPQFKKVKKFIERIEKKRRLIYKEFNTKKQFTKFIPTHFKKLIKALQAKPNEEPEKIVKKTKKAVVPKKYRAWINENTKHMDLGKNRRGGYAITANLLELFVPLFSLDPDKKHKTGGEEDFPGPREPVEGLAEIEALASRGETLLVIGRAGSGKTTLAKHMARTIVNDQNDYFEKGFLPVLIFFSFLKKYPYKDKISSAKDAGKHLLDWYCKEQLSGFLDLDTILSFCEGGKCLFILDGLDEAEEGLRVFVDNAFLNFRIGYESVKVVLLGRPHATEGKVPLKLGDRKAEVRDLTPDQIEIFIGNWFSHVYGQGSLKGKELAKKMKSDISAAGEIEGLTGNLLLLSTMCTLYSDSNELPDQRADLYRRYLDWLFSKLDKKTKVETFMMNLAAAMMKEEDRGIDRCEATRILREVYPLPDKDSDYESLFDRVEPATGLLEKKNGRYMFFHFTFQEFLTARYLNHLAKGNHYKTISPFIPIERYQEVVKLFIGFLSLDNSGTANFIIETLIKRKSGKGFYNHILAAEALLDIKEGHRDPEVVNLVIGKMGSLAKSENSPMIRLKAAEAMGRLGYTAGLEEFVAIPGGNYDLEDLGEKKIQAFEISRFLVTNYWYGKFMKDGGYEKKEFWTKDGRKWLKRNKEAEPLYWRNRNYNCPNSPVVGVSWYEAVAFCNWLQAEKRDGLVYSLPTEEEWQAAAAGKEKREYPWGNEIDPQKCNYRETGLKRSSPVGIFFQGKTPEGVHDLGGNVWEWTTLFDYKEKDICTLRGGSFGIGSSHCRCAYGSTYDPDIRYFNIGFRCARIRL